MRVQNLWLLSVLFLVACGDEGEIQSIDVAGDSIEDTTVADADAGADGISEDVAPDVVEDVIPDIVELSCDPPGPIDDTVDRTADGACGDDWVVFTEGNVQLSTGEPVECAFSQLCVRLSPANDLVCLSPVRSGTDGTFRVEVPSSARCVTGGSMRVLVPSADVATSYCHISTTTEDAIVQAGTVILFETTPVAELADYGDGSASRDVTFEGGLVVSVVPELFNPFNEADAQEQYESIASTMVPVDAEGVCFTGESEPLAIWAFSPEINVPDDTTFDVTFPNSSALAPGSTVDIFVLGGLGTTGPEGELIDESEWEVVGMGTVSEDGETIVTTTGGLVVFTFLGYAPSAAE